MRKFHIPIIFVTVMSFTVWFFTYYSVPPIDENGFINTEGLLMFMFSFGTGIAGSVTILGYVIKSKLNPSWDPQQTTRSSIRQGILIGGGIVFLFGLQLIDALSFITAGLTLVSLATLEIFFRS